MADPCVADTASIDLETTGTPAVLSASVRNPSQTFEGTFGDDTKRDVTDNNTQHDDPTGGWPLTLDNSAGSLPMRGAIVIAINPIWVAATDPISVVAFARLSVDGVVQDERDMQATGIDFAAGKNGLVSLGALVATYVVNAGATKDVDVSVWIKNIGASGAWSFRFGGSKMVVTESF